jgi:hypothetical protein
MLFLTKIQFPAPTAVLVIRVPPKDKAFEAISFDTDTSITLADESDDTEIRSTHR